MRSRIWHQTHDKNVQRHTLSKWAGSHQEYQIVRHLAFRFLHVREEIFETTRNNRGRNHFSSSNFLIFAFIFWGGFFFAEPFPNVVGSLCVSKHDSKLDSPNLCEARRLNSLLAIEDCLSHGISTGFFYFPFFFPNLFQFFISYFF